MEPKIYNYSDNVSINSSKYINHVQKEDMNPNNVVLCTPDIQKNYSTSNTGIELDLFKLIHDEKMIKKFENLTFPEFRVMTNGSIFIDPAKKIISPGVEMYIKWLVLDKNMVPVSDCNYNFVELPQEGYLVKIVIPIMSNDLSKIKESYNVQYFVNYRNIPIEVNNEIIENRSIRNTEMDEINLDSYEQLKIVEFNGTNQKERNLLDNENFFRDYIEHIFE